MELPEMYDAAKTSFDPSAVALDSRLIDCIPVAICICDASSGEVIRFNPATEKLWGKKSKATAAKGGYCGFLKVFSPCGAPLAYDQTPIAETLRTGIPVTQKEILVERADGTLLRLSVSVDIIRDEKENCTGTASVFQNITECRKTDDSLSQDESLFRNLVDHLPVAAYTCDNDGLITCFNKPAVDLWGRAPALRDPGERFCGAYKLFSSDGFPLSHERSWMAAALSSGQQLNGHEVIIERPDSSLVTVLCYVTLFYDQ